MSLKAANKIENANRVELEVTVDAAAFEEAVSKAYKKNVAKINVPGFRKGKAPRHLVEKMYGEAVFYEDAVNDLYPQALNAAIEESEYEYVDDKVDLDVTSVGKDGLTFKAVITVKPEITLGEYKGLKASKAVAPVTDDNVTAELTKLQDRNSRLVAIEDRAAAEGDTVTFDFDGYVDGEPFEGGKAENYTLKLGSNQFIPGFEAQIEGKNTGDEFDVEVTFPEDYHAENLAGKPATFKCKLHEIKVRELPELNDDLAKDASDFDTLEELKADIRDRLQKQHETEAEHTFEDQLVDQLVAAVEADIPEAMITNRIDQSVQDFGYRLQSQGLNLDTYLQYTGMDMDAFRQGFREQAEKQVKVRLALEKIVALENLAATDEELEAEYAKYAEQYKMDVEKIKSFIPAKELAKDLAVGKAMDLVKDAADAADAKAD